MHQSLLAAGALLTITGGKDMAIRSAADVHLAQGA